MLCDILVSDMFYLEFIHVLDPYSVPNGVESVCVALCATLYVLI